MSKFNRWRRRVNKKKIEPVIHKITRLTESEDIRNRAIELLDVQKDYLARLESDTKPNDEEALKIRFQMLHLISDLEVLNTEGHKKFRAQKMAYYEEKIWDLYCELNDLENRIQYLNNHSSKLRDQKNIKKEGKQIRQRIKKLNRDYSKISRKRLFRIFKKTEKYSSKEIEIQKDSNDKTQKLPYPEKGAAQENSE